VPRSWREVAATFQALAIDIPQLAAGPGVQRFINGFAAVARDAESMESA
jgi:hypothetical protein